MHGDDARLIRAFVTADEKRPAGPDRPADHTPELASLKEWVRIAGIATEARIRREVVIAVEHKPAAAILI